MSSSVGKRFFSSAKASSGLVLMKAVASLIDWPIAMQSDLRFSQVSCLVTIRLWPNGIMSPGSPSGPLAISSASPSCTAFCGQGSDIA